ncbi:MAG: hypothetical protein QW633_03840, partial [Candidatus Aenigmatarchaeota archaeon]
KTYMEMQQKQKLDQQIGKLARDRSTKFVVKMVREINILLNQYLSEHPEDKETEKELEEIREKLINVSLTKRRTRELRKIWENYKKIKDWRKLMKDLKKFLEDVIIVKSEEKMEPFDKNHLKLVVIDFIS